MSDKERLLIATRRVVLQIMENGRAVINGETGEQVKGADGKPVYTQPSAADIQAALKLLSREESKAPAEGVSDPFEDIRKGVEESLTKARTGGAPLPEEVFDNDDTLNDT